MQAAFRANILLLITAAIWGSAFVAQRVGMDHMGPMTFNGLRFCLGSLVLLPLILKLEKNRSLVAFPGRRFWIQGMFLGLALFLGAYFQQLGICYTTAGKAGFITGLYVVFVPLFGMFMKQKYGSGTWFGALLCVIGMYFLSVTQELSMSRGDTLVLISAIFWAVHVVLIGRFSPGLQAVDAIKMACIQFAGCGLISLVGAFIFEKISWAATVSGAFPLAYGGLMSVGIAYTLQVVAQRDARPAPAAIILSLEAVFAALAGWLILGEVLTLRAQFGCALMLGGMLLSQLRP